MKELEAFNGERSSSERHDDFADCISTVFNSMQSKRVRRPMTQTTNVNNSTKLAEYKRAIR